LPTRIHHRGPYLGRQPKTTHDHAARTCGYARLRLRCRQGADHRPGVASRYDKTRLIGLLDELERDGLITRKPDPTDRRARTVNLTPAGKKRHAAAQADVRAMEDEFLGDLSATERDRLLRVLARLANDHPQ
jgi:hypothetical protein